MKVLASGAPLPQSLNLSNISNHLLARNYQIIMDAQQRQNFLYLITGASTASRQNTLNEESPSGDESDEGDDWRETGDEKPSSSFGAMPAFKSIGIKKKKTRTVFSRSQVTRNINC
ncbi:unnamed protein product [Meloidogyne enterolobii]|uniref:Uncharacterized protein n=1 Tax=Meloidogyne enterolobii TaxID=390850 RepID=A0ACB0YE88_MELEN